MAFANTTRIGEWGLVHQFNALVAKLNDQRRRYRVYRQTIGELKALSDRDLADLGIARSMIESIAMEAAQSK
jgi:uncharacterized protein YjiS (DUF1127 family)